MKISLPRIPLFTVSFLALLLALAPNSSYARRHHQHHASTITPPVNEVGEFGALTLRSGFDPAASFSETAVAPVNSTITDVAKPTFADTSDTVSVPTTNYATSSSSFGSEGTSLSSPMDPLVFSPVPEPATWFAGGLAALAIAFASRRAIAKTPKN